jgi:SHS2 domain-containing protein
MRAHHTFLEHTSETVLQVRAATLGELLAEAGRALAGLQLRSVEPAATGQVRTITVTAADDAVLVVDWLNELLYLAERERWVAVAFDRVAAGDGAVQAAVRGMTVPAPPAFVKAATLGGLRLARVAGGLEAEVTLDV